MFLKLYIKEYFFDSSNTLSSNFLFSFIDNSFLYISLSILDSFKSNTLSKKIVNALIKISNNRYLKSMKTEVIKSDNKRKNPLILRFISFI